MALKKQERGVPALVLGIVGVMTSFIPIISLILDVLAIVFATKTLKFFNGKKSPKRGMAIAGLVCGIVGCFFSLFYTIIWATLLVVGLTAGF